MRRSVDQVLRLALDLCLGLGAFLVTPTGAVEAVVSDALAPEDGPQRVELLARSCLAHPAATGRELFWNAETSTEAEAADDALACVVVPLWNDAGRCGLLGVVDTWLPEPDEVQRSALVNLASELSAGGRRRDSAPAGQVPPGPPDGPRSSLPGSIVQLGPFAPGMAAPGMGSTTGGSPGLASSGPIEAGQIEGHVLRHLPDAVVVTKGDGTIVLANVRFACMVGQEPERLVGTDVRRLVTSEPGRTGASIGAPDADGRQRTRRLLVAGPSGDRLPVTATDVRIAADPAAGPDGGPAAGPDGAGGDSGGDRFVTVLRPAPSPDGCSAVTPIDCVDLVGNLDDGVLCLDGTGTVVLANRAADRLHGLPAGRTLVGSPLPELTGLRTEDGQLLTPEAHPGMLTVRDGTSSTVHLVLGEGDRQQHVTVTARPFPVDGHRGALVVLHDSTSEWLEQQRLTQYALYDPLTGLANRYMLSEELRRMLLWLGRQGGAVALVYLDLDGFKRINDEYGHETGDEVLAAVARRLRGAVRSDDVVARLGGDEFVIAHASMERLPDGDLVVSRLRKVLSAPFRVRNQVFDVCASIGWVSTDRGEEGPDALLAKADRAMYLQKRSRAAARRAPA